MVEEKNVENVENEKGEWRTFKARVQKLRRIVVKKQIAEELGIQRGDIVEVKIRKVPQEELMKF